MVMPARSLKSAVFAVLTATVVSACASGPMVKDPRDPWEGFNRAMFSFNEGLDSAVLRPLAKGYETVAPAPIRTGVSNVFANVEDLSIGVNNLLQGKPVDALSDLGRLVINSTVGIFGLIDVASHIGLEKHNEDFGQTLGRWGVAPGPYVVLPVFGPRNVRDSLGKFADMQADPVSRVYPVDERNVLLGTRLISNRAAFLPAEAALEEASMGDKYLYMRDTYLQRRNNLVYDGRPPRTDDDDL